MHIILEVSGPQVHGDRIYVADAEAHNVRAVQLSTGAIVTVVGRGDFGGDGDGGLATEVRAALGKYHPKSRRPSRTTEGRRKHLKAV